VCWVLIALLAAATLRWIVWGSHQPSSHHFVASGRIRVRVHKTANSKAKSATLKLKRRFRSTLPTRGGSAAG
jgi:hypothetical protein